MFGNLGERLERFLVTPEGAQLATILGALLDEIAALREAAAAGKSAKTTTAPKAARKTKEQKP